MKSISLRRTLNTRLLYFCLWSSNRRSGVLSDFPEPFQPRSLNTKYSIFKSTELETIRLSLRQSLGWLEVKNLPTWSKQGQGLPGQCQKETLQAKEWKSGSCWKGSGWWWALEACRASSYSAYEGPAGEQSEARGRAWDYREWQRLCQTGSSVPLPEGPQLSSGPVDCDREGILTQYHQISPFFKNSMESWFQIPRLKILGKSTKYRWVWVTRQHSMTCKKKCQSKMREACTKLKTAQRGKVRAPGRGKAVGGRARFRGGSQSMATTSFNTTFLYCPGGFTLLAPSLLLKDKGAAWVPAWRQGSYNNLRTSMGFALLDSSYFFVPALLSLAPGTRAPLCSLNVPGTLL